MREQNLVFLIRDSSYDPKVVNVCPVGVTVDTAKKTWSLERGGTFQIGSAVPDPDDPSPALGVYDATNVHHLNQMVYAARMATMPSAEFG